MSGWVDTPARKAARLAAQKNWRDTPARKAVREAALAKARETPWKDTPARKAARDKWNAKRGMLPSPNRPKLHPALPPVMKFMFEEKWRQGCTDKMMGERVGMTGWSFPHWRAGRADARLSDFEACLNVLGYTLRAVPLKEDR